MQAASGTQVILAATAAIFLLSAPLRAEAPGATFEVQAFENVPYYDGKDADRVRHKLDIFAPKGRKDAPVLFFVHGGAWLLGDKSTFGGYTAIGRCLASMGMVAVLPNYRLSPGVKHPEHVRDVARAFAWTHANIAKYGGRPDQMFVSGHSAGGHLVALLASDDTYLKAHGLGLDSIRGVIPVSGVYRIPDLSFNLDGGSVRLGDLAMSMGKVSVRIAPLKLVFGDDPKMRRNASPIAHVKPGLPPFLVIWADLDIPPLPYQARQLAAALKEARCDVQTLEVRHRTHVDIVFGATTPKDPVMQAIATFMNSRLHAPAERR